MKLKFIYTFFLLSLLLLVFSSSKNGRANAGWGNTGAPGDQLTTGGTPWTCQTCHNSSEIQVTQTFELTDDAGNDVFATGYVPGETYNAKLTVNVVSGTALKHGFQVLCLNAGENMPGAEVSNWTAVSTNVAVRQASNTSRTYVEHAAASDTNEFTMTWVAPEVGSGEVTFYAVSIGANDDDENGGDGGTAGTYTLAEGETISTKDIDLEVDMSLFPNPVETQLSVSINSKEGGLHNWSVIDLQGRTLQNGQFDLPQGESLQDLTIVDFAAGLYQFQLEKEGKISTQTLVKK